MDTSKNEMVRYAIGTNETVWYFNGTVNSSLLHYYRILPIKRTCPNKRTGPIFHG